MIQLRPAQETDLDFVLAVESANDNRPYIGQWSREQHHAVLTDPDHRFYIVERNPDHTPVGYVILQGLTDPNRTVQIRRIAITEKGKGYGRQTLRQAKQLAFKAFNTHRLWLDVKTYNPRAQHLYQSEGFVVEGTLRECLNMGDRFESLTLMSMLRHEYEQREGQNLEN